MSRIDLTLILPCYNEAEHFKTSVWNILGVLKKSGLVFEVLLIDDKSADVTPILIKKFLRIFV